MPFDLGERGARPTIVLCNLILAEAMKASVTDIRVEGGQEEYSVRFLVDGQWRQVMRIPANAGAQVANRLRVMAGLDRTTRGGTEGTVHAMLEGAAATFSVRIEPTDGGGESFLVRRQESPGSLSSQPAA